MYALFIEKQIEVPPYYETDHIEHRSLFLVPNKYLMPTF